MSENKALLHVCCTPCSAHVIEMLKDKYKLSLFFYNPNIYPETEYYKRKEQLLKYAKYLDLAVIDSDYNTDMYYRKISGFESKKEGGERCNKCFELRLYVTAKKAEELYFEYFTTTLTISPHKKSSSIISTGKEIEKKNGIKFIDFDFKKNDGFKKTMEIARSNNFYIQNYCGCKFSLK